MDHPGGLAWQEYNLFFIPINQISQPPYIIYGGRDFLLPFGFPQNKAISFSSCPLKKKKNLKNNP